MNFYKIVGSNNCHTTTTTTGATIKTMVQQAHMLGSRGMKRSYNPEGATDDNIGQIVYSIGSNNISESMKRQKCQSENKVQSEKELLPGTGSSPKSSCISLENLKAHLECPVCLGVPKVGPIYQCRNGHLLCKDCHPQLKHCPLCQIPLEKLRNLLSEQLVSMIYPEYQFSVDRTSRGREVIWRGQLHWRENPRALAQSLQPAANHSHFDHNGQQNRVEKNVNLSITTAIEDGTPQVIPMNWPSSLVMQTIPISLINRTGKQFFSSSRTVLFHPSDEESLKSLTTLLGGNNGAGGNNASGLAGCVHFSGVPNCDIKVLILLYSPGKKVFLGFIPNDQTNFVERIREEIRKEKSKRDILAKVTNNMNLVSSSQQYHHQQQQQQQPSRQQQQPQQSIIQQQ